MVKKLHLKESTDNDLKYSKNNILDACEWANLYLVQEYPNGKLKFIKDDTYSTYKYFNDWADLIDFLEHYDRYYDDVPMQTILTLLNK